MQKKKKQLELCTTRILEFQFQKNNDGHNTSPCHVRDKAPRGEMKCPESLSSSGTNPGLEPGMFSIIVGLS